MPCHRHEVVKDIEEYVGARLRAEKFQFRTQLLSFSLSEFDFSSSKIVMPSPDERRAEAPP
jgi:hypothetical protein